MNHPRDDHDLPARQEEAVRRLLAESAGDEPMPAEVGARMDGLLTELSAERAAGAREVGAADAATDADPPVTTLRSRRRRRLARGLLAAAAAVVVVGIGLQWADRPVDEVMGAVTESDPDRGDAAGSAAEESSRDTAVERAPEGLSDSSAPETPDEPGADDLGPGDHAVAHVARDYGARAVDAPHDHAHHAPDDPSERPRSEGGAAHLPGGPVHAQDRGSGPGRGAPRRRRRAALPRGPRPLGREQLAVRDGAGARRREQGAGHGRDQRQDVLACG